VVFIWHGTKSPLRKVEDMKSNGLLRSARRAQEILMHEAHAVRTASHALAAKLLRNQQRRRQEKEQADAAADGTSSNKEGAGKAGAGMAGVIVEVQGGHEPQDFLEALLGAYTNSHDAAGLYPIKGAGAGGAVSVVYYGVLIAAPLTCADRNASAQPLCTNCIFLFLFAGNRTGYAHWIRPLDTPRTNERIQTLQTQQPSNHEFPNQRDKPFDARKLGSRGVKVMASTFDGEEESHIPLSVILMAAKWRRKAVEHNTFNVKSASFEGYVDASTTPYRQAAFREHALPVCERRASMHCRYVSAERACTAGM
jgi:hypothetical protein